MKTVRIGIIGSGWISVTHMEAFRALAGVKVVAQHSRDEIRAKAFCKAQGIPAHHSDLKEMLARKDIDAVTVSLPNSLHAPYALQAIRAGKHVIVEKPLCLTLAEADEMIAAAKKAGVIIGYAEELCYIPKFVRAKELADSGAIGDVFFVKQSEKHAGPYSPWFFQADLAGGGILMDMGCHAIEYCRWTLGKPAVKSVYCDLGLYSYAGMMELDDHCVMIIEFEGGKKALVESSWTLKGGMESRAEIHGTKGVIQTSLLQDGFGMKMFSEPGSAGDEDHAGKGWTHPGWAENWQNGYPQEMQDFVNCIRNGGTPLESGIDGRVVLEIMIAGYLSAATGKRIDFPFKDPGGYKTPVEIWLKARRKAARAVAKTKKA
ncbi:MAG: Gfo/Idh/MocA family oxidoreductase [Deltaproteobacteria bacterium]|nr:Gfo/Idh/MocA family oxidoreductase [Deltaproteobacteria bacterium]